MPTRSPRSASRRVDPRPQPTPRSLVEATALCAVELFNGLPADSLSLLQERSKVQQVRSGHLFFEPGQSGDVLFVLESGHVQTFRMNGRKKLIVAELAPPAIFGEMTCFGQRMYHCAARATEESRIRVVSREALEAVMERHPEVTRRMLEMISTRFVRVLLDLEATSFQPLLPRLAALLLDQAGDDSVTMTHQEMAERLRVYRESATAALGELKRAGIVALERKRVVILDRKRLQRAAQETSG